MKLLGVQSPRFSIAAIGAKGHLLFCVLREHVGLLRQQYY